MRTEINAHGSLVITPETEMENYAAKKWFNDWLTGKASILIGEIKPTHPSVTSIAYRDIVPKDAVEAEREACAKICDERKWRGEPLNFAEYCAEEIRMRSNVKLTGAL